LWSAAQEILTRNFRLDAEEIEAGLTDGGSGGKSDGGIDAWYLIVNGRFLRNPSDANRLKKSKQNTADVVIIQATREKHFGLDVITRLENTLSEVLNVSLPIKQFSEDYNDELLNAVRTFRKANSVMFGTGTKVSVHLYYVSQGNAPAKSNLLSKKGKALEQKVKNTLPTLQMCGFHFVGATEMVRLLDQPPKNDLTLLCDSPALTPKNGGCIALVTLQNYFKFIADKAGNLRTLYLNRMFVILRGMLMSISPSRRRWKTIPAKIFGGLITALQSWPQASKEMGQWPSSMPRSSMDYKAHSLSTITFTTILSGSAWRPPNESYLSESSSQKT